MSFFRQHAIGAGLGLLNASRLDRLVAPITRGLGAILMFHHVRPASGDPYAPNGTLEITPEFLDVVLRACRASGFQFVTMDELVARLTSPSPKAGPPMAAVTFDDGLRDNVEHALPVLEANRTPFAIHVTTGFADGTARLWWVELEEAIRALDDVPFNGEMLSARTAAQKELAFEKIYWTLRAGPEQELRDEVHRLVEHSGIDATQITSRLCLGWDELAMLARHPLCTIGVHTQTHPMLLKQPEAVVWRELAESRRILQERLQVEAKHLAYPVGDTTSVGPREFSIARELGFASAVTTRKGMLFPEHRDHLMALPRLSISGMWQSRAAVESLLSGAPFYVWNRGRRIAA